MSSWLEVWSAREFPSDSKAVEPLELALRLDGYDTTMAKGLTPNAMRALAARWGKSTEVASGDSVYEVGCGCGAFLAAVGEVHTTASLAGSDYSAKLVEYGRELFPWIDLAEYEGSQIPVEPRFTHVSCVGAFMYFANLDYAEIVLNRMMAKSTRTVSILDIPDLGLKAESEESRRQGYSDAEYAERYRGLDHLYFDRSWFIAQFDPETWRVSVHEQDVDGYANSAFRFNVFAQRRASH